MNEDKTNHTKILTDIIAIVTDIKQFNHPKKELEITLCDQTVSDQLTVTATEFLVSMNKQLTQTRNNFFYFQTNCITQEMSLKVYAFFNMRKDDDGGLYLDSGNSFFYEAQNEQTKDIRQFGVEQGILDSSELYQTPKKQTAAKKNQIKEPSGSKRGKQHLQDSDEEHQLSEDSDIEEIHADSTIIERQNQLETPRKISRSQFVQTTEKDTNNQRITQQSQPAKHKPPKKQKTVKHQTKK